MKHSFIYIYIIKQSGQPTWRRKGRGGEERGGEERRGEGRRWEEMGGDGRGWG